MSTTYIEVVDPWLGLRHKLKLGGRRGPSYFNDYIEYGVRACEEVVRESEDVYGIICTIPDDAEEVPPEKLPSAFREQFDEILGVWRRGNVFYVFEQRGLLRLLHEFTMLPEGRRGSEGRRGRRKRK